MSYNYKPFLKVLLLGDSSVGKTALVNRFVNEEFVKTYKATVGADFFNKDIFLDGRMVALRV